MNDHDQFVHLALAEFPDSAITLHVPASEIHGRILTRLGEALDRRGPIRVQCPRCNGDGCPGCEQGRIAFDRVRNDQGARLELGLRLLTYAATEAGPDNKHWLAEARDALERRRAQLTGGR